jgi:hypothetical protein
MEAIMLYFKIFWKNYRKTQRTCHDGPSPGRDLKLEHQVYHSHHNTDLIILHTTTLTSSYSTQQMLKKMYST